MNQGKSEYSRPDDMPPHNRVNARDKPKFHRKQFQTPSFSDHSLVFPSAGVMYIIAMAKAMEIQPKITAITWTWRMWPNEKNSLPMTKSGNANLAALKEPSPVPITNQIIAEIPKYTDAAPCGMSSLFAKRYFNMTSNLPLVS